MVYGKQGKHRRDVIAMTNDELGRNVGQYSRDPLFTRKRFKNMKALIYHVLCIRFIRRTCLCKGQ